MLLCRNGMGQQLQSQHLEVLQGVQVLGGTVTVDMGVPGGQTSQWCEAEVGTWADFSGLGVAGAPGNCNSWFTSWKTSPYLFLLTVFWWQLYSFLYIRSCHLLTGNFTLFWWCLLFFFSNALAKHFSTLLNRDGESRHPYHRPNLRSKNFLSLLSQALSPYASGCFLGFLKVWSPHHCRNTGWSQVVYRWKVIWTYSEKSEFM